MSTRWYPLYQKGNPQLRVFLPNFWLKLVAPESNKPKNIVQFQCSMEMTRFDVQNYLEKIYNVHPVKVNTRIAPGKTRMCHAMRCVVKDDDIKIAYVYLPKDQTFTYPDLFPQSKEKSQEQRMEETEKEMKKFHRKTIPGLPGWFRI